MNEQKDKWGSDQKLIQVQQKTDITDTVNVETLSTTFTQIFYL